MKKAFLILAVIFIAAGVFAQSAAYTKYVKLAKDYEAKKAVGVRAQRLV